MTRGPGIEQYDEQSECFPRYRLSCNHLARMLMPKRPKWRADESNQLFGDVSRA
ncbi:hypothetical protein I41_28530 [Lacipirellula limnantheis]|uniref:Uncharacterized protein n=1 Tax=Lacipirellula limnantheis TaxID=2528024 RepID=A0A517TZ57_9BACT|nr:hypothetical protein I41_28530 [Lacipirellula limnantheis]